MKSIAVLIAVALVAIACVMSAPEEIVINECRTSNMCKSGCRAIAKLTSGVCHTEHFRRDASVKLTCLPAPHNAMCVYHAIYNRTTDSPNATCADKNLLWLNLMQCNICRKWDFGAKHHTTVGHALPTQHPHNHTDHGSMIITGCNAPGSLTVKYGCDDTCTTCMHSQTIKEKTCLTSEHFKKFAFGYSTPAPCKGQIVSMTYNNSDCDGSPTMTMKMFQDACESRRGHSHFLTCTSS